MAFLVRDVMTRDPVTVSRTTPLAKAARLMQEHGIRHLPVVDHIHHVIGVLSQKDLIFEGVLGTRNETTPYTDDPIGVVGQVMTKTFHVVRPNDRVVKAGQMMRNFKYGCLPVVEDGKLVGVLTATDFIALVVDNAPLFGDEPDAWGAPQD